MDLSETCLPSRPLVLIVDDAAGTREGLAQLLQLRGYDTLQAASGAEGLDLLGTHPGVRVVVLDLSMPQTDGWWFRERQLESLSLASIPVVVFTGMGDPDALREQLKVEHVLQKPVSVDALLNLVSTLCAS